MDNQNNNTFFWASEAGLKPASEFQRNPLSVQEQQTEETQEKKESEEAGFGDKYVAAFEKNNLYGATKRTQILNDYQVDESFSIRDYTDEEWSELTKDIRPEFLDEVPEAVSHESLVYILDNALKAQEQTDTVDGHFGAELLSYATDPAEVIATMIPVGKMAAVGSKLGKLKNAGIGAASIAAPVGVIEGMRAEGNAGYTAKDATVSTLFAGGLGAAVGAFSRINKGSDELSDAIREEVGNVQAKGFGDDSASAARVGDTTVDQPREAKNFELRDENLDVEKAEGLVDKADFSFSGQFAKSDNPVVRKLGDMMLENSSGAARTSTATVEATQQLIHNTNYYPVAKEAESLFKSFKVRAKREGLEELNADQFDELAASFIESEAKSGIKEIDEYVTEARELFNTLRKEAKGEGRFNNSGSAVKGFETLEESVTYLPKTFSHKKIRTLSKSFDKAQIRKFFSQGFRHTMPDVIDADELARIDRFAHNYADTVLGLGDEVLPDLSKILNGQELDTTIDVLRASGIDEDAIEDAVYVINKMRERAEKSPTGRGRHRAKFDNTFRTTLTNIDGEDIDVGIENFVERRLGVLLQGYSRDVSGHSAFAKFGIRSDAEWSNALTQVKNSSTDMDVLKKELDALDTTRKMVLGKSLTDNPNHVGWAAIRSGKNLATAVLLDNVLVSSMPDLGNLLGYGGFKVLSKNIPVVPELLSKLKSGKGVDDDILNQIQMITGQGMSDADNKLIRRFSEEFGELAEAEDVLKSRGVSQKLGNAVRKTDEKIRGAMPYWAKGTGLVAWDDWTHQLAVKTILHKFGDVALGGQKKLTTSRLEELGLDADKAQRIFDQFNNHGEFHKGVFNQKTHNPNIHKWDDAEALEDFMFAVNRKANVVKQRNQVGDSNQWLASPAFQFAWQYRTFSTVAWTKQSLRGVRHADREVFQSFVMGLGIAMLARGGFHYMKSVGMEDSKQKEYREKHLNTKSLVVGGLQYTPQVSLIPMAVDTPINIANWFGADIDPMFGYRNSGLTSGVAPKVDPAKSVPAIANINNVLKSFSSIFEAMLTDKQFTQKDFRQLQRSVPFGDNFAVKPAMNLLEQQFPES